MNQFKLPLFIMAILMSCFGLFAFNTSVKEEKQLVGFKLKIGGVPTNIADWEPAGNEPGCPSTHTQVVCRIYAEDDNGMPSQESFDIVLDESDDFNEEAYGYVEYRQD